MKKFLKLPVALFLVVLLVAASIPTGQAVSAAPSISMGPANPEFMEALQTKTSESSLEDVSLGLIPNPVEIKKTGDAAVSDSAATVQSLPSVYPTDKNYKRYQTAVKDQDQSGACWAFASLALTESNLLKNGQSSRNFSERNMMNASGFDKNYLQGGNFNMAMAYLSRWSGPVDESEDYPFIPPSSATKGDLTGKEDEHIQDAVYIVQNDFTAVKQAVMQYGAAFAGIHMYATQTEYNNFYNSNNAAFYCYDGSLTANHAVTIVGWDDTYSKNNFRVTPSRNGAFIIKNSWGTSFGKSGYFYISYDDVFIGDSLYAISDVESPGNYDNIYQYDPLGWCTSIGFTNLNTAWFTNVYRTSANAELLKAVSFYTTAPGASYQVYVSAGTATPPDFSSMTPVKTGTFEDAGYHTVVLPSSVTIPKYTNYTVCVKATNPTGYNTTNWPIAVEYPIAGYSSGATISAGQSFVSYTGNSWLDLTATPYCNVCLKALTDTAPVPVTGVTINKKSFTLKKAGATYQLTATVAPSNATNKAVKWTSSNTKVATVDSKGKVTAKGNGQATITATTVSGGKKATCAAKVQIAVTGVKLNKTSWQIQKGRTYKLTATVSPSNAYTKAVKWTSSNKKVATVDSKGKVTAKSVGKTTIAATTTSGGKRASCTIYVISATQAANPYVSNVKATSVRFNWTKIAGSKVKYKVYRATSKTGTYSLVGTTSNSYMNVKSLKANKNYYFKVRTVVNGKYKEYSTVVHVKTPKK